mgnify:CR=1 FL=1|tara:strand:+ start:895 stop:1677 length:783 start_codon:yes stop_codon:yes gene_type:complete
MLVNKNKKGTIILSHYRSGGTQMSHIVERIAEHHFNLKPINLGEVNFDNDNNLLDQVRSFLTKDYNKKYQVILLNNPNVITFLNKIKFFDKLVKDYNIFYLNRKNKVQTLLSLPLWEAFISTGLYDTSKKWTKDNMIKFHNNLLVNPIPWNHISLGDKNDCFKPNVEDKNKHTWLNWIIKELYLQQSLNRLIKLEHKLPEYFYEDYEDSVVNFAKKNVKGIEESTLKYLKQTKKKIPYISGDYSVYFDEAIIKVIKEWQL